MTARTKHIPLADLGLSFAHHDKELVARSCDFPGCEDEGDCRAPRNRDSAGSRRPQDYFWFCRLHAREYNAAYNYFEGWDQKRIEAFQKDALTGHRPTWEMLAGESNDARLAQAMAAGNMSDLHGMFGDRNSHQTRPELPEKIRRALAILDIPDTASLQEIKMRYKELVKRYHPDANGGDKQAEERFKKVNEAYNRLVKSGHF